MAHLLEYFRARKGLQRKTALVDFLGETYEASYFQQGQGPELLHIVTSFGLISTYMLTIEKLAVHFRVTAVELPGAGLSSKLAEPWHFRKSAEFAVVFARQLGLKTPWVLGHSQSGAIAALMLAQAPDDFAGGVFADPVGAHPSKHLWPVLWGRIVDGLLEPGLVISSLHHVVFNLFRHFRNFFYQTWICRGSKVTESFPMTITKPVLLVWGRHDHEMPIQGLSAWFKAIPQSKTYISERGSHDFVLTRPEEFVDVVLKFVNSVDQKI